MTLLPPAKTAKKSLLSAKNRRLFTLVLQTCEDRQKVWFSMMRKIKIMHFSVIT